MGREREVVLDDRPIWMDTRTAVVGLSPHMPATATAAVSTMTRRYVDPPPSYPTSIPMKPFPSHPIAFFGGRHINTCRDNPLTRFRFRTK